MAVGTDNLKKLIDLGLSIPEQISKSGKDGWSFLDIFDFTDEAYEAYKVGKSWQLIVDELKDLDATERDELYVYFADKFNLPDDKVEFFVEKALQQAINIVELVEEFKKL